MYPAKKTNEPDPGSRVELSPHTAKVRVYQPPPCPQESLRKLPARLLNVVTGAESKPFAFRSLQMVKLLEKAQRYARSSAPILITGESGTGKELLSRLIHQESPRAQRNFVAVNCAAMPELLVESELFGHERGAFTGAFQQRVGHFQFAHQGTLMLDEITEIPVTIQAKLLRVIEEQEVLRIGRSQPEKVDVRVLATSNRELQGEVEAGNFRLDLFFRLNVLQLQIPPLRQRIDDIPYLADHFLQQFRSDSVHPIRGFTAEAKRALCDYHWPGNIRELRNVVQCACIECDLEFIDVNSLPPLSSGMQPPQTSTLNLDEVEKQMIFASLEKHDGNKKAAAAELGVTSRTLNNKLKLYRAD